MQLAESSSSIQVIALENYHYFWIMKIKRILNLIWMGLGLVILLVAPEIIGTEMGLALGIPFLMLGLYGLSRNTGKSYQNNSRSNL